MFYGAAFGNNPTKVILTTFCQQIIPCIVMPISGNCKVTLLNVCGKTSSALMVTPKTFCEMEKAARATCVSVPWLLSGTIHFCINCTVLQLTPRIVWACPEATWDLWHDGKLYCKKLPLVLHFQSWNNPDSGGMCRCVCLIMGLVAYGLKLTSLYWASSLWHYNCRGWWHTCSTANSAKSSTEKSGGRHSPLFPKTYKCILRISNLFCYFEQLEVVLLNIFSFFLQL